MGNKIYLNQIKSVELFLSTSRRMHIIKTMVMCSWRKLLQILCDIIFSVSPPIFVLVCSQGASLQVTAARWLSNVITMVENNTSSDRNCT